MGQKKLDNRYIYKITKDSEEHIGTDTEISKILKIQSNSISALYFRGYKVKGYKLERIGVYRKFYTLSNENKVIGNFVVEDIVDKLYISKQTVLSAVWNNSLVLDRYHIKFSEIKPIYF